MQFTPELIAECQRIMRTVARGFQHCGIETDDLISCAWLRVCRRINDFDERRSRFPQFVSAHARYAMKDYLRELAPGTRKEKGQSHFVSMTHDPEHCLELSRSDTNIDNRIDVALLLARLNAQERRIVRLRFYEERELKEIGRLYGYGQAWAWVRIREALGKMAA